MKSLTLTALFLFCACSVLLSPERGRAASAQKQTGEGKVTPCDVAAYVNDGDPNGLNVRSEPGSTHKIVGNLPNQNVEGIGVHITGSSGEWVRIDRATEQGGDEDRTLFSGVGWVYGPLLGTDGVGGIPGGTPIYNEPTKKSRVLARMLPGAEGATVRGCRGKWMYVEHKGLKGWAEGKSLCYNSLTTCS